MIATTLDRGDVEALDPDSFSDVRHALIWRAIAAELADGGSDAPSMIVARRLVDKGAIQTAGGHDYIDQIVGAGLMPRSGMATLADLAAEVQRLANLRQLRRAALDAADAAGGNSGEPEAVIGRLKAAIEAAEAKPSSAIGSVLDAMRGDLSEAFRPGIATGTPLDHRLELVPGRMFVVGGRPGHGKTTMLLQLTLAALTRAPESVALFASCEMNAVEIGIKALSCLEGRNFPGEVRLGGEAALVDVIAAREMWAPLLSRLVVLTTRSMEKVEAEATRISRAAPLSVVSVDYLQRFNYSGNLESHALAVGEVSGGCKALAQRLDVVVLAGAQLNRAGDDSKPPTLKHLKASGDIEQDADGVALLHRPDQDDPEAAAQLLVAKNRWGELGAIRIEPDLACHRFGW